MPKRYLNEHDLVMRLDQVICFYKGEPYYIRALNGEFPKINLVNIYKKDVNQNFQIDHDDPNLDTSFPELGYFNYQKNAIWLSKFPDRKQAQGLRAQNIRSNPTILNGFSSTKDFYNFLKGDYPTVDTALDSLKEEKVRSIAVSRNFALSRDNKVQITLLYRKRPIGFYCEKTSVFRINQTEESSFLTQAMFKSGVFNGKTYN